MTVAEKLPLSAQDYLEWERVQGSKHEYVQGGLEHVTVCMKTSPFRKPHNPISSQPIQETWPLMANG